MPCVWHRYRLCREEESELPSDDGWMQWTWSPLGRTVTGGRGSLPRITSVGMGGIVLVLSQRIEYYDSVLIL